MVLRLIEAILFFPAHSVLLLALNVLLARSLL